MRAVDEIILNDRRGVYYGGGRNRFCSPIGRKRFPGAFAKAIPGVESQAEIAVGFKPGGAGQTPVIIRHEIVGIPPQRA